MGCKPSEYIAEVFCYYNTELTVNFDTVGLGGFSLH